MFALLSLFAAVVPPADIQTFIVQFTLGQAVTPPTIEIPDLTFQKVPINQIMSRNAHYALQTNPTLTIQANTKWTLLAKYQSPQQGGATIDQTTLTLTSDQFSADLQPEQWHSVWQGIGPQTSRLSTATSIYIPRQVHITAGNYRTVLTWQLQQVPSP